VQHVTEFRQDEQGDEGPWEDIDSELSASTREVCLGYGSWAQARKVIRAAHGVSRPPGGRAAGGRAGARSR
jgi:hypothetical protein